MRSDGNPGQAGDRENPSKVGDIPCPFCRMELDPRNPSWPAVFDPHQQAGHKTAPDRAAKLQKVLAMQEPSTQDFADIRDVRGCRGWDVRFRVQSGTCPGCVSRTTPLSALINKRTDRSALRKATLYSFRYDQLDNNYSPVWLQRVYDSHAKALLDVVLSPARAVPTRQLRGFAWSLPAPWLYNSTCDCWSIGLLKRYSVWREV